jgi:iron complex outermembrane receptor protein
VTTAKIMNQNTSIRAWTAGFALSLAVVGTSAASLQAQSASAAARGSVTGRVQNVATGQYLNNARVAIKGTDISTQTDAFGIYRLASVPSGPVVLTVFYTNLDAQEVSVEVPAGGSVERDVGLTSAARYGNNVIQLDPLRVIGDRETDAQALAINEQRFAPNIKNVVSTDSLGDVLGYNVGEFMKLLPGVTTSTSGVEVTQIGVRGFDGSKTSVSTDGIDLASAEFTTTRAYNMVNLSLNDISRIEVTKVPTPSMPANSVGGNVNMITKSAFERNKAQLRVGLSLVGNSKLLDFEATPYGANDRKSWKILPAFDFDLTQPIGKNFGFVVTAMHSHKYNPSYGAFSETWQTAGTSTGASITNPYFQSLNLRTVIRDQRRQSFNAKADWRVTPESVLSIGGQWNRVKVRNYISAFVPSVGTNGTPTPATGVPLTFGPDFTRGATGRGSLSLAGNSDLFYHGTKSGNIAYRFDNGRWKFDVGFALSDGTRERPPKAEKHNFSAFSTTTNIPIRVAFDRITPNSPQVIQIFDNNNVQRDIRDLSLHRVTTANIAMAELYAGLRTARANVMRRLQFLPFQASVQVGAQRRIDTRDARTETETVTYNGPATLEPFAYRNFTNPDRGFAPLDPRYPSGKRLFEAWEADPALFTETAAQKRAREAARLTGSEYARETIDAGYFQFESSHFHERLKLLTGVRFEKTTDYGEGSLSDPNAVFVRNANGTFARTAAGARIRKPEAGVAGSIEELALIQQERAAINERSYDGYYPSLHLTWSVTENFLARFGYARSFTRPNFSSIIPRTVINENDLTDAQLADPSTIRGTLTVRNTALKPWTADNYDLSLEYYTQQGGVFSAGAFVKDIEDFFSTSTRQATAGDLETLGFDAQYAGWNIATTYNGGDARISGFELNARQSLARLGGWGRHFTVFANGTRLRREGRSEANFNGIYPKIANWGVTFSRGRLALTGRWSYRGWVRGAASSAFGADAFEWTNPKTTLDVNVAWRLTRRFTLNATVNNITEEPDRESEFGSVTPGYARQTNITDFGSAVSVGIRGTF